MSASIYLNTQITKVLPSLLVTVILSALALFQPAQAELTLHNSKDASGQAVMVVTNDSQKELPPAQLGISPSQVDETVSLMGRKNQSKLNQSLTLYNYGSKPKSISLNLVDMNEQGTPIAPSESTLKPWTLINPTEFTIAPGGYQTVRMSIRLPMDFAMGKHRAMLSIEQKVAKPLTYDADGKGVTLEIGSRYGLPIRINVQ